MTNETIVALATPSGVGAIAVIRLSGTLSFEIIQKLMPKTDFSQKKGHNLVFGIIKEDQEVIDEVLVSIFKGPHSYTKEDVIEISCHASNYIINKIISLCIDFGAVPAKPGEFTQRAYLNGQLDLAQAEAVIDVISAESEAAHKAAIHQLRGGFSKDISQLRQQLIDFASLIELELDFGEEDVEFANRTELKDLVEKILGKVSDLIASFKTGNVLKKGIPIVIAGKPNAGKSTLLNQLLNEEKAIVSNIAGTTRDVIEDIMVIDGIQFRFIDTAGLRETSDTIEAIGVERTKSKMEEAELILYMVDISESTIEEAKTELREIEENYSSKVLVLFNKVDEFNARHKKVGSSRIWTDQFEGIICSAKEGLGLKDLKQVLVEVSGLNQMSEGATIVTNARHHASLTKTNERLTDVLNGLETGVTGDFIAMDIRQALYHLGEITGEISADDLLGNIFGKFCIGK